MVFNRIWLREALFTGCEVDLLFIADYSSSVDRLHEDFIEMAIDLMSGMKVNQLDFTEQLQILM